MESHSQMQTLSLCLISVDNLFYKNKQTKKTKDAQDTRFLIQETWCEQGTKLLKLTYSPVHIYGKNIYYLVKFHDQENEVSHSGIGLL